jgi:hypothetical protein
MDRLLHVTTGVGILLLVMVLTSLRRSHIRVEYSVTWLAASVGMLVFSLWRGLLDAVRNLLGLPDSPLALFLLGAAVLLVLAFRSSLVISHLRDNNIALAQRVAILELRLRDLEKHES